MHKVIHSVPIILASQSKSRAQILDNIGIPSQIFPSGVDEDAVKTDYKSQGRSIEDTALRLAREKAERVSIQFPDTYVIGADQMMLCDGRWFDKAESLREAREQLEFLRGKNHSLPTACVLFNGGTEVWSTVVIPTLKMRLISDTFIDWYLDHLGDEVLRSVGCYQIEGPGAQLFEEINGDIFTIMGLPVLPLMGQLRQLGALLS